MCRYLGRREGGSPTLQDIYLSTYLSTSPTFDIPTPLFPLPLDYILVLLLTKYYKTVKEKTPIAVGDE